MKPIEKLSYAEYRVHMQEIAKMKEKILRLTQETKDAHRKYREYWRLWDKKKKQKDAKINELLKILPSKI